MTDIKGKLPIICPSCESELKISKLHCSECGTEVVGNYNLPLFVRLSEDERGFILEFVKASGSLKNMSERLKLSYPTVRNILDDIIEKVTKMEE